MRFSASFFSRLFLSGLILAFPLMSEAKTVTVDRIEASVNSKTVLLSDVFEFRRTLPLRAQLDPLFRGTLIAKKGNQSSDQEIVQFLIDEAIINQEFPVKDTAVEKEITSIQSNNGIDRATLVGALKQQGFQFKDYFKLIRTSIAKRNLIDRDIRTKVHISDDDVKNQFYNREEGGDSLSYRIRILTINPRNYQKRKDAIKVIQRARRQVTRGEGFEEVAKRFSDDQSAAAGGDLGYLNEDSMSDLIRNEVKRLKVGQVSRILGSETTGYFFVKLEDIRSDQDDRLKKQKEEIRNRVAATEYQRQVKLWIQRKRQEAFIHLAGEPSIPPTYVRQ